MVVCCGQPARLVVQSINLEYWFCDECRQEPASTVTHPILEEVKSGYDREIDTYHISFMRKALNDSISNILKGIP